MTIEEIKKIICHHLFKFQGRDNRSLFSGGLTMQESFSCFIAASAFADLALEIRKIAELALQSFFFFREIRQKGEMSAYRAPLSIFASNCSLC